LRRAEKVATMLKVLRQVSTNPRKAETEFFRAFYDANSGRQMFTTGDCLRILLERDGYWGLYLVLETKKVCGAKTRIRYTIEVQRVSGAL